jgi:hypothetical protein
MIDLENNEDSQVVTNSAHEDLSSKGMTGEGENENRHFVIEGDDGLSSKGMMVIIEGDDELSSKGIPTKETITKKTSTKETITKDNGDGFILTSPEEPSPKNPKTKKRESFKQDVFVLPDWIKESRGNGHGHGNTRHQYRP